MADRHVDSGRAHQEGGRFLGARRISGLKSSKFFDRISRRQTFGLLHFVEVANCQFQDVCLFQLRNVFSLSLKC
jgi:hypothetical protein